jgi:sulfate permease, SulP family
VGGVPLSSCQVGPDAGTARSVVSCWGDFPLDRPPASAASDLPVGNSAVTVLLDPITRLPRRLAIPEALKPKLFTTLRGYTAGQLRADLTAGVIVGIVALPLAIAFAIASGVTPQQGLYTAIIAGFIISVLGGSRVQIGGPTGAFVVIVYGIVQKYGIDGLTIATIMGGCVLVVFGLARFGSVIKFMPFPVITGFTSGIAVIIFSSQVKDLLGLRMGAVPAVFLEKWGAFAEHIDTADWRALAVAAATLALLLLWPRVSRRVPAPFVALIAVTAGTQILHVPVETIGSRFGAIHAGFPALHLHPISLHMMSELAAPAFAIALLGAVESLLSAVVADGMIGGHHRSDVELIAQGVANIVAPLFGGIPATGAIARTATNVKNGGRTPVAGIAHAVTLLLITVFFGRWASLIPMACLAAILTVVAYQMSEWRTFVGELHSPRGDVAVLLVTFSLTVLFDLTIAIEVGIVLAAFLFLRRMAATASVRQMAIVTDGTEETSEARSGLAADGVGPIPRGVQIYEIAGPLFFGAAAMFKEALGNISKRPSVLIIRMGYVPVVDATGLRTLADIVHRSRHEGTLVILCELHEQPAEALKRSTVLDDVGEENLAPSLAAAVSLAREHLESLEHLDIKPGEPPVGKTGTTR